MNRTMYDSTNMPAIPADAQIVAGYPHAFPVDYARFPKALQVRIDQHGNHPDDCHVVDVETGAVSNAGAVQWVRSWLQLHPHGLAAVNGRFDLPTVYANLSTWDGGLRSALFGLPHDAWVAEWGTGPTVIPGSSLHQYENTPGWDKSVVYDETWGLAGSPPPPPGWQEAMMRALPTLQQGATGTDVRSVQGLCNARLNAGLVVDGAFGPLTDGAVKRVQASRNLPQDGVVDPATWQALMAT